jgi:general secretion pathway protein H
MRISATGNDGFTLVELLATLTIFALASATLIFVARPQGGGLVETGERFAARVKAARDHAIIGARPVRIAVTAQDYGFSERRDGAWRPLGGKAFKPVAWPEGVAVAGAGELDFDATGLADEAQNVVLVADGARLTVRLGGEGAAHVAR